MMIIRLHTLSAHAPSMQDAQKVVELMHMSDEDTPPLGVYHEDDLKLVWQQAGFQLMLDAWMIVTRDGQLVGYADVQKTCEQSSKNFTLALYIHPDYRSRGIETLLIRLGEERVHQICRDIAIYCPIKVTILVSRGNRFMRETVQYEGYRLAQQFLRMHIAPEQMVQQSFGLTAGLMRLDVPLAPDGEKWALADTEKVAVSAAKFYDVYEKMLEYSIANKAYAVDIPALQDTTV